MMAFLLGTLLAFIIFLLLWFFCNWFDDFLSVKFRREQQEIVNKINERLSTIHTVILDLESRVLELEKRLEVQDDIK